ncbi:MAG: hypothetical protein M3N53_02210 [Actinomycetota bacterium]|nr:hypothetical protein [Actinomycetota bacterium]
MRKLIGVLTALALLAAFGGRAAAGSPLTASGADVTVYAAGGTQLSNGFFFPGTAIANGNDYIGEPLVVPEGSNLRFFNLDVSAFAGAHKITSFKRVKRAGKKVPLFASKLVDGPGEDLVITSHVKPGTYPYFCPIHAGMFGLIEVR